jgi:N12 class adenine-specific DNA methylase
MADPVFDPKQAFEEVATPTFDPAKAFQEVSGYEDPNVLLREQTEELQQQPIQPGMEPGGGFAKSVNAMASGVARGFEDVATATKRFFDVGPMQPRTAQSQMNQMGNAWPAELVPGQTYERNLEAARAKGAAMREAGMRGPAAVENFAKGFADAAATVSAAQEGSQTTAELAESAGSMGVTALTPVPGAGVMLSAMQTFGSTYKDARDAYKRLDFSDEEADRLASDAARISAIGTGMFTKFVPEAFGGKVFGQGVEMWMQRVAVDRLKSTPLLVQAGVEVLKDFAGEATEEGLDQLMQGAVAMKYHRPDMTWEQALKEAGKAGLYGGITAGALKTPMALAGAYVESRHGKTETAAEERGRLAAADIEARTPKPAPKVELKPQQSKDEVPVVEIAPDVPKVETPEPGAPMHEPSVTLPDITVDPAVRAAEAARSASGATMEPGQVLRVAGPQKAGVPLLEVRVKSEDGKWKYLAAAQTNEEGVGTPWTGDFDSRPEAIQAAHDDLMRWWNSRSARAHEYKPQTLKQFQKIAKHLDALLNSEELVGWRSDITERFPRMGFNDALAASKQASAPKFDPAKPSEVLTAMPESAKVEVTNERPAEQQTTVELGAGEQQLDTGGQPAVLATPGLPAGEPSGIRGLGATGEAALPNVESGSNGGAGNGGRTKEGRAKRGGSQGASGGVADRPVARPGPTPGPRAGAIANVASVGNQAAAPSTSGAGQAAVAVAVEDQNHVVGEGDSIVPVGAKVKAYANAEAIKLLKKLEAENRNPTPEEKQTLARYTGWGGLPQAFDAHKEDWRKFYDGLRELLTPQEWEAARASTVNAHYTSREVIRGIWDAVDHLGFKGGKVLEPSAGIGHFIGLAGKFAGSKFFGVELDSITGRILSKLYPQADIQVAGFQDAKLPRNFFDLVTGNVPFSEVRPYDPAYPQGFNLHNYFIVKGLDHVKPGGLLAVITSTSTLDRMGSRKAREAMAGKADLVGAIRLPNNAFKANAGTEVTTDILFFRKKDTNPVEWASPFIDTKPLKIGAADYDLNEYFAAHPEMMLGVPSMQGTMYGGEKEFTLEPAKDKELPGQISEAVQKLPADVMGTQAVMPDVQVGARAEQGTKEGQTVVKEGKVYSVVDGALSAPGWSKEPTKVARAKAWVGVRDVAKALIAAENNPESSDEEIAKLRGQLNKAYDGYRERHGALTEIGSRFLEDDPEYPLMLALERAEQYSVQTTRKDGKVISRSKERYHKADIFTKRLAFPRLAPSRADTPGDAVAIAMAYKNKVDAPYIAQLLGTSEAQAKEQLLGTGLAFENPSSGLLETPDEYLSGFVRKKLREAQSASATDPRYQRNVEALGKVQPEPIPYEGVSFRLGSYWLEPKLIEDFLAEALEVRAAVGYNKTSQGWTVTPRSGYQNAKNVTTYGTKDFRGDELVLEALQLKSPVAYDYFEEGGKKKREKNLQRTLEAEEKQAQIKQLFLDWVGRDPGRRRQIEAGYNEAFNGARLRKYRGPEWDYYPGASTSVKLRPHQKAVVTRILQNSTLLAHSVGTGKTYVMATAAMEMKRLGMAKKPMIVTQNATTKQLAGQFLKLYPTARLLVPSQRERSAEKRQKLMARIATGEYDAVIVPQSFINQMPDDRAREESYIAERLNDFELAIGAEGGERSKNPSVKQLMKGRDRLREKLKALKDRKVDNVLTFDQLGVDAMFVDEAHAYKKLEFTSKMDNVKGLDRGASERGFGMFMKTQLVHERNAGKNVVFATGTPVSNTLAEAWNMMRYLRPDVLKEYNIENFDDFASTFGEVASSYEMTAGGTWKQVSRFAKYTNGPELIKAFHEVADVVLAEDVDLPGVPALKNGRPTNVVVPRTPAVSDYVNELRARLEEFAQMSGREKRKNSHIPITVFTAARKASVDMRLVNPSLKMEPGNKFDIATRKVREIYDASADNLGTQMVFADLFQSTPNKAEFLDEEKTLRNPAFGKSEFNLYEAFRARLVELGVPAKEIAVITDYDSDPKRETLFTQVNEGKVRVLLGSTEKMGIGVNVQERLAAVHHLDAPHRPMDIEQRNGRILRQGNSNGEVEILTYGVENTLDAAMYQKLATKQKFINQILRGDLTGRNFEDAANEISLTFEEQMAAFSGDPLALEKITLENRARQLESLRASHIGAVAKARDELAHLEGRQVPETAAMLNKSKSRAEDYGKRFAGEPTVTIGGKTYTGKKDGAAALEKVFGDAQGALKGALLTAAKGKSGTIEQSAHLGVIKVNGLDVDLSVRGVASGDNANTVINYSIEGDSGQATTGAGFFQSLGSVVKNVGDRPASIQGNLDRMLRNITELRGFVTQPFDRQSELDSVGKQYAEVLDKLKAAGQATQVVDDAVARVQAQLAQETQPSAADLAKERLASGEAYGKVNLLGLQSAYELVRDLTIVGAHYLGRGFTKFRQWSAAMIGRLGQRVAHYLPGIWGRVQSQQFQQQNGLSAEGLAAVNRIEAASAQINKQPEFRPVYPQGKFDNLFRRMGRMSKRLIYFGSPELLRAKQTLDLQESYQAAAVKEQSDRLLQMLEDSAYKAKPDEWKLPKWMRMGGWATRLREFKKLALPIAAHLNAVSKVNGQYVFQDFDMRAGWMSTREFTKGQHQIGDVIAVDNPLTGEQDELTIAQYVETPEGRRGYQLVRRMPASRQQELFNYFHNDWPEFMWLVDIYVDPDLASARFETHGVQVPVFNRFALAAKMAAGVPSFTALDAYTPDVVVTRSLLGAVKGALGLRRGTRSPGRKYKSGQSRESGNVRDLMSGFNIRTFQVLQEQARKDFFKAIVDNAAVPIPKGGVIPEGYIKLETGFDELWQAVKRFRTANLAKDPVTGAPLFPQTEARMQDFRTAEYKAFFGEASQLRGKQRMIPKPLVDMMSRKYVAQEQQGRLMGMFKYLVRNSTQLFLAHAKTYVGNVLTNDMFAGEAAYRYALSGAFKLWGDQRVLGQRDLRVAANILGGMALHRFRGLRELLHFTDKTRYMQVTREVLPDSVFADSTQLSDVKVRYDDKPFDLLRRGQFGAATLQAMQYGAIDVRAKQRLAYAYLKANAVTAAKQAGMNGPALRAAVDAYMFRPTMEDRVRAVAAANFEMLNYADSPEWLNRFSRNDLGRLVLPFPRFGYHFLAKQFERLSALKLFVGKVPRGQRADAVADLITVATFGLGGGGVLLHAAVKALVGWDDDDDPRKYIGTSQVKYIDENGDVKTKAMDRELVTANRMSLSYMLRSLGIDSEDDTDFWVRTRQYPALVMAGAAVLGWHDAKEFGWGHGVSTYLNSVADLGSDFFSVGMALKVPDKILATLRSLESGKPEPGFLDPYATKVPLAAYITEQAIDSIVPGSRQFDEVLYWIDPVARRKTESKQLDFHPGPWEVVRTSHIGGVLDRLFGAASDEGETSLPAAGTVEDVSARRMPGEKPETRLKRMEAYGTLMSGRPEANMFTQRTPSGKLQYRIAYVPEDQRQPLPLASRVSSLAGFNVRPVPRGAYLEALDPELKKKRKVLF